MKCCRCRLCYLANASLTRLVHPGLLWPLETKTVLKTPFLPRATFPLGPSQTQTPALRQVWLNQTAFIKRLLKEERAGYAEGKDNPALVKLQQAVGFRDLSELGARSHRPRWV